MSNSTHALTKRGSAKARSFSPAWCVVAYVSRAVTARRSSSAAASASPSVGSCGARGKIWDLVRSEGQQQFAVCGLCSLQICAEH